MNTIEATVSGLVLIVFIFVGIYNNSEYRATLRSLEGRITLHEGKGQLTAGPACIIHSEALKDKKLTLLVAEACFKAQQEKTNE